MTLDVASYLGAVMRTVSALEVDGKPARAVTLGRTFDTAIGDLWDALTNAERIPRWFMPITGELKLGGRYQLEGNAGGVISDCEPPSRFALTWEFGEAISWVEVLLSSDGANRTRLKLTHTAHLSDHWTQYGPGAVGVGWELGLLGLDLHIVKPEEPKLDEEVFSMSPEGKALGIGSAEGWGQAAIAAGEDSEAALAAVKRTAAFYTGTPEAT